MPISLACRSPASVPNSTHSSGGGKEVRIFLLSSATPGVMPPVPPSAQEEYDDEDDEDDETM